MFHPIGPQNPTVYWRRRLLVIVGVVVLVVLAVLTVDSMRSDGASKPTSQTQKQPATGSTAGSTAALPPPPSSTSHSASRSKAATTSTANGKTTAPKSSTSTTKPISACVTKQLQLRAVVGKSTYKVGDRPLLQLQVTNTGTAPCVQNLADKEVEMRVYNGESRVWGSHDCKIMPGTTLRTLNPKVPVLVSIQWSGLSSQPKCAGTRQRVNAGTYTLYAALAGRTGTATQFALG